MPSGLKTLQKTQGIPKHPSALMRIDRGSFRITDLLVIPPSSIFAFDGQGNGFFGIDLPRVIQIQIQKFGR